MYLKPEDRPGGEPPPRKVPHDDRAGWERSKSLIKGIPNSIVLSVAGAGIIALILIML